MKPQTIFPKGDSYIVQFAVMQSRIANSDIVQLHMRARHEAGCKGAWAGNQKPDIKFVWPTCK